MRKRWRSVAAAVDQQIAIADARHELPTAAGSQAVPGQWPSSAVASSVEIWPAVKSRIVWSSTVTRLQRIAQSLGPSWIALRRGFQRGPAGEVLQRVVAQQAQIGHVRAGRQTKPARDSPAPRRPRAAKASMAGVWAASSGVLPPKRLLRLIGTAVGNDDGVFHVQSDRYQSCTRIRTLPRRA